MNNNFYVASGEIMGLAKVEFPDYDCFIRLVSSDPHFYFGYLREKYYEYHASYLWKLYPNLSFYDFHCALCLAIEDYIRSILPDSMKGVVFIEK